MSSLSTHFAGQIEYDAKTEGWIALASRFINEKNSLPIIFQEITWQRNQGLFITKPTDI